VNQLAFVIGLLVTGIGILGVLSPATLLEVARFAATPLGLYVAAAVRIVFGLILMGAAAASRAPRALRVLGAFIVLAGIITLFIGVEGARSMLDFLSAHGMAPIRSVAALALLLGLFIVYAAAPRSRAA